MRWNFLIVLSLTALGPSFGAEIHLGAPARGTCVRSVVETKEEGLSVVCIDVPACDIQEMWMPSWVAPRQDRKWNLGAESAPQCDIPFVAYFNTAGTNAFSIGVDSLRWDSEIRSRLNQERGCWEVTVTVNAGEGRSLEPFAVTLDRRAVVWTDALADWRRSLNVPRCAYPEAAWKPVYCSWYAVHAAVTQDWTERTAKIAADLGFKTFILDDGWSYDEMKRVNPRTIRTWYRDTGKWDSFSRAKFPDFPAHRRRMREFGLNYLVWVAPYFVGTRSAAYQAGGFEARGIKPFEGNVLADPADRSFMDAVDEQLVRLMKEADLDGLKIDFLDYIRPSVSNPRGAASLEYIGRLIGKLRAVKPDGLFEFRQGYATPQMARFGTQFRAGDVPFEWLANLLRMAQIRLTMGDGVPVHADPISWAPGETPGNINRHFMSAMVGVPMLSMDLERLSAYECSVIQDWLAFYVRHVEKFQKGGKWNVVYKNGGVAYVTSELAGESLVIVNDPDVVLRLKRFVEDRKPIILNLTYEALDFGFDILVDPASSYPARNDKINSGRVKIGGKP